jgi:hypothetical protein
MFLIRLSSFAQSESIKLQLGRESGLDLKPVGKLFAVVDYCAGGLHKLLELLEIFGCVCSASQDFNKNYRLDMRAGRGSSLLLSSACSLHGPFLFR